MKNRVAIKFLSQDPIIKELILKYGVLDELREANIFQHIVETIIGQQLSTKAADTIIDRFTTLFNNNFPTPEEILERADDDIRSCGISYPKIKYIKGLCKAVIDKSLDLENITQLGDEEVLAELTALKGIGRWTGEMILIFTLGREDIFSVGDLGLRTAVSRLYGVDREDLVEIENIAKKWSPYRSIASRYLWKSLDNK